MMWLLFGLALWALSGAVPQGAVILRIAAAVVLGIGGLLASGLT